ncbi:thiamine pyrophosphate protein [Aliidongia dinghuensis]|uniref:Thiamine pyrophosphate protein n=1 Tax=Aliidongia dinghuensis TaxID=1867774 RepID=A0A8J2YS76_9PROT|nr:thiamine pyrophosphate-binding protein [Aliidongia dinghuensis]GGF13198.1 thiamine pyrophosphate protein [Aliidongia dinghuensis]
MAETRQRTGGEILVDQLKIHGVDLAFGVPGESYLAVLDALYDAQDQIKFVICRHEAGAANMAEAYGKLTGRPGICMVTRGPGASHAAIGLHTAFQDSTPLILFIGQVGRDMREREAFQEVDYRRMFGQMAKWVAEIDDAERIPEFVNHAFALATSGRPGPVVLALPEDMLTSLAATGDAKPYKPVQAHPGPTDMAEFRERLANAKRPFMIVGGGTWNAAAKRDIEAFATAWKLPTGVSFRCQDYVDNTLPIYAGDVGIGINPKLAERVRNADLLIACGPRLGEMTTSGYTLVEVPVPKQTLVHIHPGAEELNRVYQPALAINSGLANFAAAAAQLAPPATIPWGDAAAEAHEDYLANQKSAPPPGPLDMVAVVEHLREVLPSDAILTNGAGNYTVWFHRFYRFRDWRTQLGPTSGAMGYAVPSAVAAAIMYPDRTVVSLNGDGCFLMNGQEIATAVQYGAKPIFLVINNGMYGTIRMHQERHYPARISGTELHNPDFAAYARAFGAYGEVVTKTEEFGPAFERARSAGTAALLELRLDPEALTPRQSLSQIRATALAAKDKH